MPVADVHVPVVSEELVATLYATTAQQETPARKNELYPEGTVGVVVEPSRKTHTKIRSPAAWLGIETVFAAAEAALICEVVT